MRIWYRALGEFATNCYIVAGEDGPSCAIIDPGQPDPWIKRVIATEKLDPQAILLTHAHLDHIGGVEWVKSFTGAPVSVHAADAPMLTSPALNGSLYFETPVVAPPADRLLQDGQEIAVGGLRFTVLHTPGHTPGGVCFYTPGHLISGDTLFAGSVGRTDLPGGNHEMLIRSIRAKLLPLPAETAVHPGHGPATCIGDEKEYNPFL